MCLHCHYTIECSSRQINVVSLYYTVKCCIDRLINVFPLSPHNLVLSHMPHYLSHSSPPYFFIQAQVVVLSINMHTCQEYRAMQKGNNDSWHSCDSSTFAVHSLFHWRPYPIHMSIVSVIVSSVQCSMSIRIEYNIGCCKSDLLYLVNSLSTKEGYSQKLYREIALCQYWK